MTDEEIKGAIEAILFLSGSKVRKEELTNYFSIDEKHLESIVESINEEAEVNKRGIIISKVDDGYQMGTSPRVHDCVADFFSIERELDLSQAALEVLAIVAYNQPVTRQQIEEIRGVRSDKAIATLLERGLIAEVDRLDSIGHPIVYGTTDEFLRCFNLKSIEDLKALE
ncbi:SMC-Scp complex subunit ScpB [Caldanaerobius polysaccharolyticus]|uniref:SMC-Scp complex subunit ScpB n=1 Tax=Caldanaerobius polysaccharolyticus TaxID=44256 RepID=UPI000B0D4FAC|nr:SMC-Scp complex subunit ScpB [Caldanaerobius polysaccharolyticus]